MKQWEYLQNDVILTRKKIYYRAVKRKNNSQVTTCTNKISD